MSILDLPNEILHAIFEYLPLSDRSSLSRTCNWLYNAVSDYPQPAGASVTLRGDNISSALRVLTSCRQHVSRLSFEGCDLQHEAHAHGTWRRFWDWLGPGLDQLTFRECEIGERPFMQVLAKCPRLTSVTIDDCNSLLMSGKLFDTGTAVFTGQPSSSCEPLRESLRCLSVRNTRYLSDALFNRMIRHFVNLEQLSLAGCQISFHSAIYKRFYPANRPENTAGSESILTFQNVLAYVASRGTKIASLDLGGTQVDDSSLSELARVPGLRLHELRLAGCHQITRDGVSTLCQAAPWLHLLDLTNTRVTDGTVLSLTAPDSCQMSSLSTLNLAGCLMLTDVSAVQLGLLTSLRSLNLSGCLNVTSLGLQTALESPALRHLTDLNLARCKLDEMTVLAVATGLVQLRHLDLSECGGAVTNAGVQAIAAGLRWLRTLRLAWSGAVGYAGLAGQPDAKVTRSLAEDGGISVCRLAGLRELSLRGCSEVTDAALLDAIQFRELTSLDLSLCAKITDTGLRGLGQRNPSLETLHLNNCHNLTDDGVVEMVGWLPRMRHLYLLGCRKISVATLAAIERSCPQLRDLSVSVPTPSIVLKDLEKMESNMKCLRISINPQFDSSNILFMSKFI